MILQILELILHEEHVNHKTASLALTKNDGSRTSAEGDGGHFALLSQGHNGCVGPDVVKHNRAIQETDSNDIDDGGLCEASDGRVEALEGIDHGAGANVPNLHRSLVASNENLVQVCAGVDECRNGERRVKVDGGVKL